MSKESPFGFTKEVQPVVRKKYYIDEVQNNKESIVTVVRAHGRLFCTVKNSRGYEWDTMCGRLTEIS